MFSVINLNLDIKINILSFGRTLGLIWRLSSYGSGHPGIDFNDKHYIPSCIFKYRFIGVRISILMKKIWLDNLDPALEGPASRSGGKSPKIDFMYFNLLDFLCNKAKLRY